MRPLSCARSTAASAVLVSHKPGTYPLIAPTTVLQLIATAGGLKEYADSKKIIIIRTEGAAQVTLDFNYKEVVARKNMSQNILLRPGDTVVVPE